LFEVTDASNAVNMENAAAASRHTLLMLTPAWVNSQWTRFEALLVHFAVICGVWGGI
jgi:predicted sugar kinase